MGQIVPFNPPPGVFRNGTQYQTKGRWFDSNLVRWKDGRLRPIGGWSRSITSALTGTGRAMFAWKDNSGSKWLAVGTSTKLYVFSSLSGTPADITPTDLAAGNNDAAEGIGFGAGDFNGTTVTKTLTASDISATQSTDKFTTGGSVDFTEYFAVGDEIQASGFSNAANNKTYTDSHRVTAVSATELTLGAKNGSSAYGGSTLADESAGASITLSRARRFGNEATSSSSLVIDAASWTFDVFGQILLATSTADGRILYWDPSVSDPTSTKAAALSNAPTSNSAVLVSKERHVFAFGAGGDPRRVSFSDQENRTSWTATATNQAGGFSLNTNGEILNGKSVGSRILVWTTTSCHAIDHVGAPFVYGRTKIGDACGAISNRSMAVVGDTAFWMSHGGFFTYQGSVQPLPCTVSDYIFEDINHVQDSKIHASVNSEYFEITWWYASGSASEIDRYVTYNFQEGWWSIGKLTRTAWEDAGVFERPVAISDDNIVYQHELNASTSVRSTNSIASTESDLSDLDRNLVTGGASSDAGLCFAETGAMEIGNGENVTHVSQLITDQTSGTDGLRFKFKTRLTPNSTETESDALTIQSDGYTDCRVQGRQFSYRVESGWDQNWDLGTVRADIVGGGRR